MWRDTQEVPVATQPLMAARAGPQLAARSFHSAFYQLLMGRGSKMAPSVEFLSSLQVGAR